MSQDGLGVDLETSLGYLLKQASSALRAAWPPKQLADYARQGGK